MAEAAFLLETGWTHEQYEAAPDIVVRAIYEVLNAKAELSHRTD